eukprot:515055-Pelagomonas_calceolata.AAC.2
MEIICHCQLARLSLHCRSTERRPNASGPTRLHATRTSQWQTVSANGFTHPEPIRTVPIYGSQPLSA